LPILTEAAPATHGPAALSEGGDAIAGFKPRRHPDYHARGRGAHHVSWAASRLPVIWVSLARLRPPGSAAPVADARAVDAYDARKVLNLNLMLLAAAGIGRPTTRRRPANAVAIT
jgi:hypothetical protein